MTFKIPLAALALIGVFMVAVCPGQARAQPFEHPPYPRLPGYEQSPQGPSRHVFGQGQGREQERSARIRSPREGALIPRYEPVILDYAIDPGGRGDHVNLYVDGQPVARLRRMEGRYRIGRLRPGRHNLAIEVIGEGGVPLGIEAVVTVYVR